MFELKPLSPEAVDRALAKVERYRLLNEPREAASICRDILKTVPDHQEAIVGLLLSLTDQFGMHGHVRPEHARELLQGLTDAYTRAYFAGVIAERWGKARLAGGDPGHVAYEWFVEAMECFERAEELSPVGNDDAILRWNSCVRIIESNDAVRPRPDEEMTEQCFADHVP